MSWVIVTQQLAPGSGFEPHHCNGGAGPSQLFLKGAGPSLSYLQTLKISVENSQNILKCFLEEGEKERRVGRIPFRLQLLWRVVPRVLPGLSGHRDPPPHGWHVCGASSRSFSSHTAFPPVRATNSERPSKWAGRPVCWAGVVWKIRWNRLNSLTSQIVPVTPHAPCLRRTWGQKPRKELFSRVGRKEGGGGGASSPG